MPDDKKFEVIKTDYPSNSNTQKIEKAAASEPPKREKVVAGKVKRVKRGFGKKFAEAFLDEDGKNVGSYVIHEVLIPSLKAALFDMVYGGLNMVLYGSSYRRPNNTSIRREDGKPSFNYNSLSSGTRDPRDRDRRREISRTARARHDFDEIVFETRGEAEEVLANLVDLIVDYQFATVADFYGFAGADSDFTDGKYGWYDLRGVKPRRVRDGYILDLPRTQPIE